MITKHKVVKLGSPASTGAEMMRLVKQYAADIGEKAKWSLPKYYDFVKKLPYRKDPDNNETLARPLYTLSTAWPYRDCDDKAILIGSWLFLNKIPFKFRASSSRKDKILHHVYVIAKIGGKDLVIDATYPKNTLGTEVPITAKQDLEEMDNFLHTFEGAENPELGFSFKSLKRKAFKVAKKLPAAQIATRISKVKNLDRKVLNLAKKLPAAQIVTRISKVKNLQRKTLNLAKKVSKIPVIKQALNNPAIKNAIISAIPGGQAILNASRAVKAALNQAGLMSNDKPINAAAASAAAAEKAAAAAVEAAKLAATATPEQKVVYAQTAKENADLARAAAEQTAKYENKVITLNGGAFFGAEDYTAKAQTAAQSAIAAARSFEDTTTTDSLGASKKYLIPAGIAAVGALYLLSKKKKR